MYIPLDTADYFSCPSLPITVFRRECGINILPHPHPFHELILVLRGSGVNVAEERLSAFNAGDLLLVRSGQTHHFREVRALRLMHLMILPQGDNSRAHSPELSALLDDLFASAQGQAGHYGHATLGANEFHTVMSLMEAIETGLLNVGPFRVALVMEHFTSLMQFLTARLRLRGCSWRSARVIRGFGEAEDRLAPALSHIERCSTERLKLDDLADMVGVSTRTLLRDFQVVTGRSPLAYQHGVRLHRALLQLRHTDKQVTEVAYDVGFNDLSFFNHKFRELVGQSPRVWRRRRSHEW